MARPGVASSQKETTKTIIIIAPTGSLLAVISATAGSTRTESDVDEVDPGEVVVETMGGLANEARPGATVKAEAIPNMATKATNKRRADFIVME